MGKSLFTTIEDEGLAFEVIHDGYTGVYELPEWFLELKGNLDSAETIWAWAQEHGIELAFCHRAISQMLIDFRAAARPAAKKGVVQRMDDEEAQERIDALEFKPAKRPGTRTNQAEVKRQAELKTLKLNCSAMLNTGIEDDQIVQIFSANFEERLVKQALNLAHLELGD